MITQHEIQQIVSDRLENHMSLQKLAKKYHRVWPTIKSILVAENVYTETRHAHTINQWDYDFFSRRNPITAYWAGFGFADGCVTRQKHGIRFHVIMSTKDAVHIEDFAKTIHFPVDKIMKNKKDTARTIQLSMIHRASAFEDLNYWGIVERKSYNFIEPKVSFEMLPHFLRGWFDGDGYVNTRRLEVVGNHFAIDWYIQKLRELGYDGYIASKEQPGKIWKRLLITGKYQIIKVAEILLAFDESTPRLDRKWLPVLSAIQ